MFKPKKKKRAGSQDSKALPFCNELGHLLNLHSKLGHMFSAHMLSFSYRELHGNCIKEKHFAEAGIKS